MKGLFSIVNPLSTHFRGFQICCTCSNWKLHHTVNNLHTIFKIVYMVLIAFCSCSWWILTKTLIFRWIPGVIFYLATDAMFIGLMATALCMSFFPKGVTRIALLTLLFPCLSLALCAWMTVFGFYLRLEDIAKRAEKRKSAQRAIQRGINTSLEKPTEFVNLAFDQHETTWNKSIKSWLAYLRGYFRVVGRANEKL